jgi:protein-L-isoaspartate(D-aspartate) O-methyltransferase
MVASDIAGRGIRDERVLQAMREVPREAFVEPDCRARAYEDTPLPIGEGQTISQPFVVALMLEAAGIHPNDRLLEVGAGSGYAAAVASRLAARVHALERHARLGEGARERLAQLGYDNVTVVVADGTKGWPAAAPFDVIIVSAGAPDVPQALETQLAPGGRLVMPVGRSGRAQVLVRIRRAADGHLEREELAPVSFVPLVHDDAPPTDTAAGSAAGSAAG